MCVCCKPMESYSKTHHAFNHCRVGADFADSLTVHHSLGILIFQVSLTGEEGGGATQKGDGHDF